MGRGAWAGAWGLFEAAGVGGIIIITLCIIMGCRVV